MDDLTWESSDPEIQIVRSSSSKDAGGAGQNVSDRGIKRKRTERKVEDKRSDEDVVVDEGDLTSSMWTDRFAPDTIVSAEPYPLGCGSQLSAKSRYALLVGRTGSFKTSDSVTQVMVRRSALWTSFGTGSEYRV
jgi:hypothetical protein